MTQQEIYPRLTKIMRDVFDDDNLVVTPELTANDVEGWDSVSHITLVVAAQSHGAARCCSYWSRE
jgi:acyl carrier protein